MNPIFQGLIVYVAALVADVLWAKYTVNAAKKKALLAAAWGALIPVAGAVSVISYVESGWFLIPYVAGCFTGTYYAVDHEKRKDQAADS